jgi:hypothetical protein
MMFRVPCSLLPRRISARTGLYQRLTLGLMAAIPCLLASCSSKPEEKKNMPKYSQMKWSQRVDEQFRNPRDVKSSFTKKLYNTGEDKKVKGGIFKTKEYAGGKKFRDKKFKTNEYALADKKSGLLSKVFKGGDKQSPMADDQFKSPLNRYGDKSPYDARKVSSFQNDTFSTRAEPQILKKQEKNTRPLMIENGEAGSYSEFDIQQLLKKN